LKPALACLALLAACSGTPDPRPEPPIKPSATVVELRRGSELLLRVHADGALRLRNGEARVAPGEVEELLRFIVEEQRFFEIDPQALRLAMHQANSRYGSAVVVVDGATTTIEVTQRGRHHAVEQYALAFSAQRYSEVAALRRLAAIEHHLIRFGAVAHLGGDAVAQRMLRAANEQLAVVFPAVAPLTLEDLATAGTRRDGALVAHFRRDASATSVTLATVVQVAGEKPTARVTSNEGSAPPAETEG
jgi:hypothetical protein